MLHQNLLGDHFDHSLIVLTLRYAKTLLRQTLQRPVSLQRILAGKAYQPNSDEQQLVSGPVLPFALLRPQELPEC